MKKADKSISLTHILVPFFFLYNALGASAELVMKIQYDFVCTLL